MKVLGLLGLGMNPGACLMEDGRLLACAEEERFIREKGAMGKWPVNAVKCCLGAGQTSLADVDRVAIAWGLDKYPGHMARFFAGLDAAFPKKSDAFRKTEAEILARFTPDNYVAGLSSALENARLGRLDRKKVEWYGHHACHAEMAFHGSGFEEALVFVMDGSGEDDATTIWRAGPGEREKLETYLLPDSLGRAYASVTEYLGFSAYSDEGRVMGLAPYGEYDDELIRKLGQVLEVGENGAYRVNPDFIYYGGHSHNSRFTDQLVELLGPPRIPLQRNEPIEPRFRNIAFGIQYLLEKCAKGLVRRHVAEAGIGKVCLVGGVAMNCKMNGVIARLPEVTDLFVHPASYDGGACIGAAQLCLKNAGYKTFEPLRSAYTGPAYSTDQIEDLLRYAKAPYKKHANVAAVVAENLAQGRVVALYQGRMEMGARALGNRSILANPLLDDTKALLNNQVKHREDWRPFCPSLQFEYAGEYFEPMPNPWYMVVAMPVKPEVRDRIPSAVHVDGTARPQFVRKETNPVFWEILDQFRKRTGVPVLINTSFNVMGEPVINRPEEALRCFYSTGIDVLVMEQFVLTK